MSLIRDEHLWAIIQEKVRPENQTARFISDSPSSSYFSTEHSPLYSRKGVLLLQNPPRTLTVPQGGGDNGELSFSHCYLGQMFMSTQSLTPPLRCLSFSLFALVLLHSVGCGTSAYRERMDEQLQKLRDIEANQPSVTPNMLYEYIEENRLQGEKRFNLRIPRVFSLNGNVFHEQTISNTTSKKYDPIRIWPLGIQLPGYYWTYEGVIPEGATQPISGTAAERSIPASQKGWSYSFCFGAQAMTEEEASEATFNYLDALNAALAKTPNAKPAQINLNDITSVKEENIKSLASEETVSWRVIHQEADMYFTSFNGRQEDTRVRKPGVLEMYITYHKDHLVILEGTWIKGMESATLLQDFLPLVAGSVQIVEDNSATPTE